MMVEVETRADKDARTLAIARALGAFVVVLAVAGLALYVGGRLGLSGLDTGFRMAAALATLFAVAVLLRDRRR
jgi:hypothetical protein